MSALWAGETCLAPREGGVMPLKFKMNFWMWDERPREPRCFIRVAFLVTSEHEQVRLQRWDFFRLFWASGLKRTPSTLFQSAGGR